MKEGRRQKAEGGRQKAARTWSPRRLAFSSSADYLLPIACRLLLSAFCLLPSAFFTSCSAGRASVKHEGPLAYVTNEQDGSITVIDTATDRVVSTFRVGARARGVRLSPDGRLVYVALSTPLGKPYDQKENHAAAVDALSGETVATYEVGPDPEQIEIGRDGARLYASNEDAGTASVIDLKTGKSLSTLVVGTEPEGCRVSPDGRWVYVTSETSNVVSVIDTQSNEVVASFLVASRPRDLAFSPDGSRAYVTTEVGRTLEVVDTSTRSVIRTVHLPRGDGSVKPMGVVVSRDGARVYVATGRGNTVDVVDAKTFEVTDIIPVGQRPWGLGVTPDGRKVYAACGLSNEVSVIDTAAGKVIGSIKAGAGPWGVAIGR
jgi:PQQ-dependent catabolism-associated beta-propeller protein